MQAIPNAEREELWQDYLRDKEKRERDAKRAVRRERAAAFRDLLLSTPAIKVAARLSAVQISSCYCVIRASKHLASCMHSSSAQSSKFFWSLHADCYSA